MTTEDLTHLVSKAAQLTSYRTHTYDSTPVGVGQELTKGQAGTDGTLTPAQATALVASHVALYAGQRWLKADPHGRIALRQGTTRICLTPGPSSTPERITDRQAEDLLIIARFTRQAILERMPRTSGLSITCGLHGIVPPAATERLIERGYIATTGEEGAEVKVSLAGHIAIAWRALKMEKVPFGQQGDSIAETLIDVFSPEFDPTA